MDLSSRTTPHSGHGYALETTDDPDSLTATIPGSTAAASLLTGVGAGTASAGGIATAWRVCSLKKSLALSPGSALCVSLGSSQLLQLSEPDKTNTNKRTEVFTNLLIAYLL